MTGTTGTGGVGSAGGGRGLLSVLVAALAGAIVVVVVFVMLSAVFGGSGFPTRRVSAPTALPSPSSMPPMADLPIVLRGDGLGVVGIGEDAEVVLAEMRRLLGPPVDEWPVSCQHTATGPGSSAPSPPSGSPAPSPTTGSSAPAPAGRAYRWVDLSVFIVDEVFVGYLDSVFYPPGHPPLGFETEEGVTLGANLAELEATYGQRLRVGRPEPSGEGGEDEARPFTVAETGDPGLRGYLLRTDDSETVIVFGAGASCA
jgi:hypothetical protein